MHVSVCVRVCVCNGCECVYIWVRVRVCECSVYNMIIMCVFVCLRVYVNVIIVCVCVCMCVCAYVVRACVCAGLCMSACVDGCGQSNVRVFVVAVCPHHKRLLYASNEMVSTICHRSVRGPGAWQKWNDDLVLRNYVDFR